MSVSSRAGVAASSLHLLLQNVPNLLLAPVPLAVLQPIFTRVATHVAHSHPELFARLGPHAGKRFLIDPIDLPFVLVLVPNTSQPYLRAYRRYEKPTHDASIAGAFFNLLDMIDGSLDGDALFFSRDLRVSRTRRTRAISMVVESNNACLQRVQARCDRTFLKVPFILFDCD
jgi:predicted lipid carrier protein YhbT